MYELYQQHQLYIPTHKGIQFNALGAWDLRNACSTTLRGPWGPKQIMQRSTLGAWGTKHAYSTALWEPEAKLVYSTALSGLGDSQMLTVQSFGVRRARPEPRLYQLYRLTQNACSTALWEPGGPKVHTVEQFGSLGTDKYIQSNTSGARWLKHAYSTPYRGTGPRSPQPLPLRGEPGGPV